MRASNLIVALLATLAIAGCSKKVAGELPQATMAAAPMAGQRNAPGSFLAYAHKATIQLPADAISRRVGEVRKACMDGKYGECTVLGENQSAGQFPGGRLKMRAEPKAIEPLVAMAAQGAELSQRSTEAEDLADAVRDNGLRQQRLRSQHARLGEFLARKDLPATDLIALSQQMSQIETELQAAEQESAQQQRRISTNLLTLEFESRGITAQSSELRMALDDSLDILDTSVAALVTFVVALLPFALFFGVLVWILRAWLARRRRLRAVTPPAA